MPPPRPTSRSQPAAVEVRTPCRLHLGMMSFGVREIRSFGGLGVMIDRPGVLLWMERSDRLTARGPLADGAHAWSVSCRDRVGNAATRTTSFRVDTQPPANVWRTTLAPARAPSRTKENAARIAEQLMAAFDYVGIMAVEMFETKDGQLLVNEIAPRVHNSGHWTTDACFTSQFEQHIRAVCGWPLGDATRHSDAVMTNLLGFETTDWQALARVSNAGLHLYGKNEAREGRKMGHITRLYPLGTRPDKLG